MHRPLDSLRSLVVVVFGDGSLPEMLLTCLQFRLAADHVTQGRLRHDHFAQLQRHIGPESCTECRGYLIGRLNERRMLPPRTAEPAG